MNMIETMINKLKGKFVFFDLDGVLVDYHFGQNTINAVPDSEYDEYCKHHSVYANARPLLTMQKIIEKLNPDKIYALTLSGSDVEDEHKREFILKNYVNIPVSHIIFVRSKAGKLNTLKLMKTMISTDESNMVMIDDSVDILANIEENSNIICYHISSFIE